MLTMNMVLWVLAVVFWAVAILIPYLPPPVPPRTASRLNFIAAGLFCAGLTHLIGTGGIFLR